MSSAGRTLELSELQRRASAIRLALFDVDGVMTDGSLIYSSAGEELKSFHVQDGWGLKALSDAGIQSGIITARSSDMVARRARELAMAHVIQGAADKLSALDTLLQKLGLQPQQVCYTGDDIPDLAVMQAVGLAIAVANACDEVIAAAHWVTPRSGGKGAVRDACDLLLEAHRA